METTNTLENKAKFFALYHGQNIYMTDVDDGTQRIKVFDMPNIDRSFLDLTPLIQITDEDALEVFKIHGGVIYSELGILTTESPIHKLKDFIKFQQYFRHDVADFLRSKGYYIGDGTEVSFGWAKLKEE